MDLLCNNKRQNTLHFYASVRLPTVWYAGYLLTLLNGWPFTQRRGWGMIMISALVQALAASP